jgi:hypothetical protein
MLRGGVYLPFHAGDGLEVISLEAKTPQTQEALPTQPERNARESSPL